MKNARNNPEQYILDKECRVFSSEQVAFIERQELEHNIIAHLESLRCSEIEVLGTEIVFDYEGEQLNAFIGSYEIGCDIKTVLRNARKYTCCGDLIDYDGDSDLCPTCKEHC